MMKPTSTQVGLIAENLVVNRLVIDSGGRLAPFRPVADDYGIDLLLYDKSTGGAMPLQVKARTKTLKKKGSEDRGNVVHFGIREVALRDKGKTQLLAVLLDDTMTTVVATWLIPLQKVEELGARRRGFRVIRPNRSEKSEDKFVPYRFSKGVDLVERILDECSMSDSTFPSAI